MLEQFIRFGAENGALGIEVYYSNYDEKDRAKLLALAKRYNLFPTGGSDYHGTKKKLPLGLPDVPEECVTLLKQAKAGS